MKKPNFNPLFYNFLVYGFSTGGGKARPSATFTNSDRNENTSSSVDTGKEKVDSLSVNSAKKDCKTTSESLMGKVDEILKDKDKVTSNKMRAEIRTYYSTEAMRMSTSMSKEQFSRQIARIAKKTNEFKVKIEKLAELLNHKELCKKELKKVTDELTLQYQKLLLDNKYSKKCEPRHVLYLSSAYLLRWETENAKAVDRIYDVDTASRVYADLRQKKGPAFQDLQHIQQDIMNAIEQWANSEGDEDDRMVYSDRKWDNKYEAKMPPPSTLDKIGYSLSITSPLAALAFSAAKAAGTATGEYLTGKKPDRLAGYLKWAREQAKKGHYPPRPDLLRADGARHKAVITAGINPERIRRNVEFGSRVDEFRKKILDAGKQEKIKFGIPELSDEKDEGSFDIQHKNKSVGKIEVAPGGKYFLVVKDKKVDVTAMSPADVIKQIQEHALNPKVEKITVSKSANRAQVKIEGNNLPSDKASLDLSNASIQLSKTTMGTADFRLPQSFATIDTNMKATLKSALMEYATNQPVVGKQISEKITDQLVDELKDKVYPKSKKPRIVITGKASLEGDWKKNQELAKKRADIAFKRLKEKNPDLTPAKFDIKVVHVVTGPDGIPVANEAEGWNKMMEKWNKEKAKLGEVRSVAELKRKIKSATSGPQKEFVKKHFNDQRGADLLILPPADNDVKFDIVSGNQPT